MAAALRANITRLIWALFFASLDRVSPGAEIIERKEVRLARWRDGKGKANTALLTTRKDRAEKIDTDGAKAG